MIKTLIRQIRRFSSPVFQIEDLIRRPSTETLPAIRALAKAVYLGDETILCCVLGKYKMYADAEDLSVSPHLILDGIWEVWVSKAIIELTMPGMTVVDVGANLGYFSLLLADLVGPTGKVHAFEPNPRMVNRLRKSAITNGLDVRIVVHEAALSDAEASLKLVVPYRQPGGAFVASLDDEEVVSTLTVSAKRLDAYPALLAADLIKIDAEGAEQAIWHGMDGVLAGGRPLIILLEFAACRYPNPACFLAQIADAGFTLEYISITSGMTPTSKEQILSWPPTEEIMLVARR